MTADSVLEKIIDLLKIIYKGLYFTVFMLIIIGEVVRKFIIYIVRTIGSIVSLIYQQLHRLFKLLSKVSLSIWRKIIKGLKNLLRLMFRPVKFPSVRIRNLKPIKWFFLGSLFTTIFVILPYIFFSWINQLPNPQKLSYMKFPATTKFYDRNDKPLYELYAEIDRRPAALSQIPQYVIDATIAIEDQEFYHHMGFSVRGIIRALRETFLNHNLQGGSTITQQLIKNTLLTPEPTFIRKTKELTLAFWAERIYTKDEILEMYLNNVPYGGTAWGIKAASQKYFKKDVSEINLAEAALLAGLPASPTTYSPFGAHPELAKKRQKLVLSNMYELGFIGKEEKETAETQELIFNSQFHNIKTPHFVMYTKQKLEDRFGPRVVEQGGLQIKTTIDFDLQQQLERIVGEELNKIAHLNVGNAAILVTKPETGEILAMIGSRDYFDIKNDGNVNIATTLQQPGSSIKIVTYAAALQKGFTAATIIDDSPVSFLQSNGQTYKPVNYDGRFHGSIPLRWALANSYNVPAVKVLDKIGIKTMIQQGRSMGIKTWEDESRFGLSLTLGGGEVTMLDMAEVYGTLATGGIHTTLTPILRITDYQGNSLTDGLEKPPSERILSEEVAFILTDILADNLARTPAFGQNSLLNIPDKYVAVKTGTSNNKRDNWTIGYTKDFVVVVWVGNNDNSPMDQTLTSGITGATPIWRRVFDNLLQDREVSQGLPPSNLVKMPCFGRYEYFINGTQPKKGCGYWSILTPTPALTTPFFFNH